jgi:fructose-1,6-bisphosphatase II
MEELLGHQFVDVVEKAAAACGVTDGTLLKGVRFFGGGARTQALIMTFESRKIRFIDSVHLEYHGVKVQF